MNNFQNAGKVRNIKGSVLNPHDAGLRFILSVTSLSGKNDNHPLYPLFDKKWKQVKQDAKGWFTNKTGTYKFGATSVTAVQSDTWVIHMLCQDESLNVNSTALVDCLKKVCESAKYEKASVHVSSLLCEFIPDLNNLISEHIVKSGVSVLYYDEK